MINNKVPVVCTVNHPVSIYVSSIPFKREWMGKGSTQNIDMEILEQIMYDPGVSYMFNSGILYIEELQTKKDLGLEPENATKPTNIIILTDKQKRECLVSMPFDKFKKTVDKLSIDQISELAQYAIDNRLVDIDRDDYIKEKCGRDIYNTIRLNKEG